MSYHAHNLEPKYPTWDVHSVHSSFDDGGVDSSFSLPRDSPHGKQSIGSDLETHAAPQHRQDSPYALFNFHDDASQYEVPMAQARYESVGSLENSNNTRTSRKSKWKRPWFCYLISLAQVATFLAQCGHAWKLTGSPIQTKPTFNPMLGPSVYNSINMGARFVPCMKGISNITNVVTAWPCPNATTTAGLSACTLAELCSNGAKDGTQPRQWWRFIVPIFLHAGVVHIGFNLLVQLRLGAQVELEIGPVIFVPIYIASGVGGYLFGGNFAGDGVTSTGASGAIFSIISLSLLDLLYHWKQIESPKKGLFMCVADIVVSFVLGLLPGVDNFSHIGGFLIGLLLGIVLLRSPDGVTRRIGSDRSSGSQRHEHGGTTSPRRHFEMSKPAWWVFVLLRVACLVLTIVTFVLLIRNFYATKPVSCKWCKYLSCLPVSDWCSSGDLTTTTSSTGT